MQHLRGRHMLTHGQCNFFREHLAGLEPLGVGGADFGAIDGVSGGEDGNAVEVHPPNDF